MTNNEIKLLDITDELIDNKELTVVLNKNFRLIKEEIIKREEYMMRKFNKTDNSLKEIRTDVIILKADVKKIDSKINLLLKHFKIKIKPRKKEI